MFEMWLHVVFVAGTAAVRLAEAGLFDLHPLCAWFSLVAVSLGVRSIGAASTTERKPTAGGGGGGRVRRINTHAQRQWTSVVLLGCLLAVVEYGKFTDGYAHFVSWHGCVAAAAIASLASQAVAGFYLHNYPAMFKSYMPVHRLWYVHRTIGRFNVVLLGVALMLGFYSGWALHVVSSCDKLLSGSGLVWWYAGVALVAATVVQTIK